jgi:hypothetical protein
LVCDNKLISGDNNLQTPDSNTNLTKEAAWLQFQKLSTNRHLFKKGIVAIVPNDVLDEYSACAGLGKSSFLGYAFYSKEFSTISSEEKSTYPSIVNLTFLEPALAYSCASHGLLFYFGSCKKDLQELIEKKKILSYSQQNVIFFVNGIHKSSRFKLNQVLQEVNSSNQTEPVKNEQLTRTTQFK